MAGRDQDAGAEAEEATAGPHEGQAPGDAVPPAASDPWLRAAPVLPEAELSPWSAAALADPAGTDGTDVRMPEPEAVARTPDTGADTSGDDLATAPMEDPGDRTTADLPDRAGDEDFESNLDEASPFAGGLSDPEAQSQADPSNELTPAAPGRMVGFYGKLPMRGDFISRNLPRAVLRPFETWLEEVMAGCRSALGSGWQAGFDAAPMWHFWIGPAVFGTACTGAMMPSSDRAGRRFPAVVLLTDEPGPPADDPAAPRCPPPPPIAPCNAWHLACTAFLRAAPAHDEIAAFESALAALPLPVPGDSGLAGLARDPRRALWAQAGPGELAGLLADAAAGDHQLAATGRSYWWTGLPGDPPGDDVSAPPAALIALEGLPDAQVFAFMLNGAGTARLANTPGSA